MAAWRNWSGSVHCNPVLLARPASEEAVRQLVLQALEQKRTVRPLGAGHSSSDLVQTEDILVSVDAFKGLAGFNAETRQVKVLAGTRISEAGEELIQLGMSMPNTGDVAYQSLAGGFATGTHGSGRSLQNLPGMLAGCRLIDGTGTLRVFNRQQHPDVMPALQVSLGALGIFTELTLQVELAREFVRKEYCTHIDNCLKHLPDLIHHNRMFDFYWYPRSDLAKLRTCNPVATGKPDLTFADKIKEHRGWLYQVLPQERTLRYEEMEYALPFEAGLPCFLEVRSRIREKHRHYVGWRVLYRTIAADDAWLSPFYQQESVTIAVLQNHQLEYQKYFADIEPIFRAYGGRPHWGKKHALGAKDLAPLYPEWEKFLDMRKRLDPQGVFVNTHLKEILGI